MSEQVKILCVDDETNVLKALRRTFMEEESYDIYLAESGAEGLAVLESIEDIRLVISDYRMPGMTGVEFLRQVNEHRPDTVRIVLSGYADTAVVVEAVNLGHIYKFIPKPWDDNELLITIRAALEHQALRYENNALNIRLQEKNKELERKNHELTELNNHLESMVAERTAALELRNRVLQMSQSILDVLPLAVFGIDNEHYIVQANDVAFSLFDRADFGVLGCRRQDVFPQKINILIDQLITTKHNQATSLTLAGENYCCQVRQLDVDLSKGIVLTLVPAVASGCGICCTGEHDGN